VPIVFEPKHPWFTQKTADGMPYAQAGVTTHGDMLVINVAPGCEYFLHKIDGVSMRCSFCAYGAPDERTIHLGPGDRQGGDSRRPRSSACTRRCNAVIGQTEIRHIYLVGGSLTDARKPKASASCNWRASSSPSTAGASPSRWALAHLPDDVIETFHREAAGRLRLLQPRDGYAQPVRALLSGQGALRRL
jgi:hypothetical protein